MKDVGIGNALIDEFKKMVEDGRIPNVDLSQFRSPVDMAEFLKDSLKGAVKAIKSTGEIDASKGHVEHDPAKTCAAFEVNVKGAAVPDEPNDMFEDAIRDQVSALADEFDEAKGMYDTLVRSRAFIHGVRDLPKYEVPDHVLSMTDVLNDLEGVGFRIASIIRKLSVIECHYGYDEDNMPQIDALLTNISNLADCVEPLIDLFRNKLDNIVGEGWDPCAEDCECDGCCCECCDGCDEPSCDGSCCDGCESECSGCEEQGENVPRMGLIVVCMPHDDGAPEQEPVEPTEPAEPVEGADEGDSEG